MVEIMTVEDIAGWDEDLRALTDGLGWLFNRPEPRVTFGLMVRGLVADVAKKNSWVWAEYLGLATPQPLEHLLGGRVKATNLTLVGLDLASCRFLECHNRDQLRIDGPPQFARQPAKPSWTRRQVLTEEHLWRARYDRHPAGWFPSSIHEVGTSLPGPSVTRRQAVKSDARPGVW